MTRRISSILISVCLFALVLGLKLDVINRFGSDLPTWDQWDAEGLHIFLPWFEHRLGPADFFLPHNEHRIVLTKLLGFAELLVNGQWDARLQCVVNAGMHCSIAVLFFLAGCRHLSRCWHPGWFALVTLLFGLPVAWQNVLGGFHSQQYFLIGLTLGTLWLLPFAPPWSRRWWAGAVCAFLALFSMGSGLLAAAIVLPVALLQGWLLRQRPLLPLPTVVFCIGTVALGWLSRVTVSGHEVLKAHSASEFILYVLHSLQWPSPDHAWSALVLWAPLVALLIVVIRHRRSPAKENFPLFLLGLGGWAGLQIFASAYARGVGAGWPASRYVDTLVLGLLANALALAWLGSLAARPLSRYLTAAFGVVWLAVLGIGLNVQSQSIYADVLPDDRRYSDACESNVRNYLATHDVAFLQGPDIPYPGTGSFLERINLPALQAIMPVSVRRPLRLDSVHPGPFRLNDTLPRPPQPDDPDNTHPGPATGSLGLAPTFPALACARTWGSHGAGTTGEWISLAVSVPRSAYLRFRVAGDFGDPGTNLLVRDPTLGFVLAQVPPPGARRPAKWQTANVFVSGGRIEIRGRLEDTSRWFAFSEPVEMAPLSYWASQTVKCGRYLWPVAAVLALLLWGLEWLLPRRG
ncbi:MAG: hypothetical protein WCR49_09290 [Opitutae bacterium]